MDTTTQQATTRAALGVIAAATATVVALIAAQTTPQLASTLEAVALVLAMAYGWFQHELYSLLRRR